MKYLLDVNALVAFGHTEHQFYTRVAEWAAEIARHEIPSFVTSPITELGFVRVMSQAYGVSIAQAQDLLTGLKQSEDYQFEFLTDDHDASWLQAWVSGAKQPPMATFRNSPKRTVACLRLSINEFPARL